MVKSGRAKRMAKHHKRNRGAGALNLVSLMDIFTILVFFLLVNSSDVETLPNTKDLQLPESYAEEKSRENVVIMITAEQILVQGKVVASVADVRSQEGFVIAELEHELRLQTEKMLRKETLESIDDREVTIMGDRELPYSLLKKIMASCTSADYGKISLAVMQKAPESQDLMARAGN